MRMCKDQMKLVSVERVARVGKLAQREERFVGMVWKDVDGFRRGRHVRDRN